MKILVINPGGTSTKIAVYDDNLLVMKESVNHTQEDLKEFVRVFDEFDYRKDLILKVLKDKGMEIKTFDAVVGRGGLMKPIIGGTYEVNDQMIDDLRRAIHGEHAANLGPALAKEIADELGVKAYTVDPVSVDEFMEQSRITGIKDIVKPSWLHSLNHKAVARKVAEDLGKRYEDLNLIVAHLGSGLSIAAHDHGVMVDGSGGRCDGPFSPERSGGLLAYPLIDLCYSGKYNHKEMVDLVSREGGMYSYLGTKDMIEIEKKALNGHSEYKLILDTFIYQVAKEISMYGATLYGKVDKIVLTGGISYSKYVTGEVTKRVNYLSDVVIIPGEMEMEALSKGVLRVYREQEKVKTYI